MRYLVMRCVSLLVRFAVLVAALVPAGAFGATHAAYDVLGRLVAARDLGPTPSTYTSSHTLSGHIHETLTVAPTTWAWSEYVDGGRAPAVRTYPSGFQVVDVRDGVGALRSRSDAVGAQLQDADYDVYNQVSSVRLGNGVQLEVRRDVRGRVSARRYTRDGATVAEYHYTYDASDRETLRQETHAGRRTSSWTYDDDGRLRFARVGGHPAAVEGAPPQAGGYTRSYDFGNIGPDTVRLTSSTGRAPVFASERSHVDVMGHAATIRVGTSTYTRTRDALGNTTRTWLPSGLADLSYDAQSHLRRVQLGDGTEVSYAYRADGVLLRRTVTCGPTVVDCEDGIRSYVYSGLLLLEEYSQASAAATPALRVRYHYEDGSDVPVIADVRAAGTSTGAPTRYYLLTDRQGSVTGVLNASGAWVERVDYDPFGRPRYVAPDTAAPRVSRVETAGGRVRVEFSEVVQPESSPGSGGTLGVATLGAGLTVTVNGASTSGVWRAAESSSDSTVWEYEVTSAVTAGDAVSLVVSSGAVVDEWSNPIGPATVSVTWAGAAYAGVAVGSTAAVESRRTLSGNNLSFQGHLYDAEAELILARARVLDPVMGEFLQRDPEGFVDSVNVYAALANDPVNKRDPTGREACGPSDAAMSWMSMEEWKEQSEAGMRGCAAATGPSLVGLGLALLPKSVLVALPAILVGTSGGDAELAATFVLAPPIARVAVVGARGAASVVSRTSRSVAGAANILPSAFEDAARELARQSTRTMQANGWVAELAPRVTRTWEESVREAIRITRQTPQRHGLSGVPTFNSMPGRYFHGADGDDILGIIESRGMKPSRGGEIHLGGDAASTFKHGGDRVRRATFSLELEASLDFRRTQRGFTRGTPNTTVVYGDEMLPVTPVRLHVRRIDAELGGFSHEVVEGIDAIIAYLKG